jgi:DNA invertase Pin-like site-specific DNA recombinase
LLSAVAEFERELIRERVRSGLANARARGKRLGRPNATPRLVNKGLSLIRQGMTYQQAAEQSGVSISTLLRARREGNAAPDGQKVGR